MKVRNFFTKHAITLVVACSIVLIGVLLRWVDIVADEAVIDSTFDEMEQIGVQYQILLTNILEEAVGDLSIFAESIASNHITEDEIVEYFSAQSQTDEFNSLYFIELDGNGTSSENTHHDFSNNVAFQNALKGTPYIDKPQLSEQTSSLVFDIAVPVVETNKPTAVLFCEISLDDFFEVAMQNKEYEGTVFFTDSNLDIFTFSSDNTIESSVIAQDVLTEMGAENIAQAKSDIQNKQQGGFRYDYFGTQKLMVYYPIESTNAAVAMDVYVDSLSNEIIKASRYFSIVGSIIYWIIILLVIYISIIQSRSNKRILKTAYYDPLTELPNMAKLKLEMTTTLENNKKSQYSILVIDIENFKAINEMFGYKMGDLVLKTVKSLSDSFNEPSLITARIGGDKFAMFAGNALFDDLSFFAAAVPAVYDTLIPELADYGGTFKIGRYHIELGETNFDDIMAKVNLAHLKAKNSKGEMLCDYDDTLKNQVKLEADITNKMKHALINDEFKVYLQPKFSTSENKLIGAEALARWIEPDGKMIFPNEFIPLFERNGFIVELDKYILETVCKTIKHWMDTGVGQLSISVNCSRLNSENPSYVEGLLEIADKYGVPHECLEIELTESTTIENELSIEKLFGDLHKHGFKISIDDFGAGHSSLGMLKNLRVDTLKMDKSFFSAGENKKRDDLLIDSIVKMAHNLEMYVVAEGIETAEQIKLLKSVHCDAVQGYFHDKPMPIVDFEKKYGAKIV